MSKKLIAVAAAAALALTGLVGIAPANASVGFTFNPSVPGSDTGTQDGSTSALANTVPVPHLNALAGTQAAAVTADTARIVRVTGVASGDTVTVATTGAVKVLKSLVGYAAASTNFNVGSVGSASYSEAFSTSAGNVPGGGNLDLHFFTTSDVTGSAVITVTRTGLTSSKTYFFKGVAGAAHTVTDLTGVPTALADKATATFSFKVADVFGNAVEAQQVSTGGLYSISPARATIAKASGTDGNGFDSSSKTYKMTLTGTSGSPYVFSFDLGFTAAVAGLKVISDESSTIVNNPAAATANAAAVTQIAALTAQLANSRGKDVSVTKKKYNALAKRWNSAFPGQKVALKQ